MNITYNTTFETNLITRIVINDVLKKLTLTDKIMAGMYLDGWNTYELAVIFNVNQATAWRKIKMVKQKIKDELQK